MTDKMQARLNITIPKGEERRREVAIEVASLLEEIAKDLRADPENFGAFYATIKRDGVDVGRFGLKVLALL